MNSAVRIFLVSLVCATALQPMFPDLAVSGSSRLDIRAGYDTDPEGRSNHSGGDAWAAVSVGNTQVRESGGPLGLSFDLALGATAYAELTDLDRISLVATPAVDYVFSPGVAGRMSLSAEGQLVNDNGQNAWAWGGNLRLRERLASWIDLAEYLSYRELTARDAEHSGTKAAIGVFLRFFLGERWLLGVGAEYAHGNYLGSDARGQGSSGMGSQRSQHYGPTGISAGEQALVSEEESRLAGSLGLFYDWSKTLSTGLEYSFTRLDDEDGGENQHGAIVSTTYSF